MFLKSERGGTLTKEWEVQSPIREVLIPQTISLESCLFHWTTLKQVIVDIIDVHSRSAGPLHLIEEVAWKWNGSRFFNG